MKPFASGGEKPQACFGSETSGNLAMNDPRPNATPPGDFDLNRPTIIGLLYAASFLVGITGVVGLVLAYVWKGEPHEPWEETHYIYLIRTFWIGLAGVVIGTVLTVVLIGFLILLATALWVIVRTVMSLVNAQKRAAMPNPAALLF
jgi:uncharacterized membrane protein